VKTKTLITEE